MAERFHPGVPAADEQEGQKPPAQVGVPGGGSLVELREDMVAQVDRLAQVREPDRLLREPRHRQDLRHRPGSHHEQVVLEAFPVAGGDVDVDRPVLAVDRDDGAREHPGLVEHVPQRGHDVPRLEGTRGGVGQQRLVREVRPRVDHDDLGVALPHLALQPAGGVEADVPGADDQDLGTRHSGRSGCRSGWGSWRNALASSLRDIDERPARPRDRARS